MKHLDWKRIGWTALTEALRVAFSIALGMTIAMIWFNLWGYYLPYFAAFYITVMLINLIKRRSFYYHNGEEEK